MNLSLTRLLVSEPTFIVEKYLGLFKNHIIHSKGGAAAGAGPDLGVGWGLVGGGKYPGQGIRF